MSYRLFKDRKNGRKPGGGFLAAKPKATSAPASSRFLNRTTVGRGGRSGAQMQIQRPAVQQHAVRQQDEQQQRVHGISMAEVMKDLRILEEQQNEAKKAVEVARLNKQRRLKQQSDFETQLDQIKYRNGQQRAEIQRASDLLSEGQRKLNEMRAAAAKAGDSLREFDRKLKQVLETKRTVMAMLRQQDRLLEGLRKKKAILGQLAVDAERQVVEAEAKFEKVKLCEEEFRQGIRNEVGRQQLAAEKVASIRAETSAEERELDRESQVEASLKTRRETIEKEILDERGRHEKVLRDGQTRLDQRKAATSVNLDESKYTKQAIAKLKEELHEAWLRAIEFQKAEAHPVISLPPSESTEPPVLDIERISASVKAEEDAAHEEASAKEELERSVETLRVEVAKIQTEQKETNEKATKLGASVEQARKVENHRKKLYQGLLDKIDGIKKKVDEDYKELQELESECEREAANLKKQSAEVSEKLLAEKEKLANIRQHAADADKEINDLQTEFERAQEEDEKSHQNAEKRLVEMRKKLEQVKAEEKRLVQQKSQPAPDEMAKEARMKSLNASMAQKLDEYPDLRSVEIHYDPTRSVNEQARDALAGLGKIIKQRIKAAQKMRKDLKEADEREREEQLLVEQAAAAEAKRQQATRERRQKRLEASADKDKTTKSEEEDGHSSDGDFGKASGEDAAESKNSRCRKHHKMPKADDMSAFKPRKLLSSFKKEMADGGALLSTQEKKVHWSEEAGLEEKTTVGSDTEDEGHVSKKTESRDSATSHVKDIQEDDQFDDAAGSDDNDEFAAPNKAKVKREESKPKHGSRPYLYFLEMEPMESSKSKSKAETKKEKSGRGGKSKQKAESTGFADERKGNLPIGSSSSQSSHRHTCKEPTKPRRTFGQGSNKNHRSSDSNLGKKKDRSSSKEEHGKKKIRSSSISEERGSKIRSSSEERGKKTVRSSGEEAGKKNVRPSNEEHGKTKVRSSSKEHGKKTVRSSNEENGTKKVRSDTGVSSKKHSRPSSSSDVSRASKKSRTGDSGKSKIRSSGVDNKKSRQSRSSVDKGRQHQRRTEQTSGISSMERPKGRRRGKKGHAIGAKNGGLDSLGQDIAFNFGGETAA